MKSSASAAAVAVAAAAVLAASLGLKLLASPLGPVGQARPVPREEQLRRFLMQATGRPVEPVAGGWRITSADCPVTAFPSGPRGTLDFGAVKHAGRLDRIAYVYRGRVRDRPPSFELALDIVGYFLAKPFRQLNEPGYVVLVAPRSCTALPVLPWATLPAS